MKKNIFLFSLIFLLASYFTINTYADTTAVDIKLDKSIYNGFGEPMNITITAPQYNKLKGVNEYIAVRIYTSEDLQGFTSYINETNFNTGIFSGSIRFSNNITNGKERILTVKDGIKIYVAFEDVSAEASWQPYEAEVKFDKSVYNGIGAHAVITVQDNDLNLNINHKDEISVKLVSDSDETGINIKLVEKTADSGTFIGSFGFTSEKSDEIKKLLLVKYKDTIKVIHSIDTTASAEWKSYTGVIKLNKSSYIGLYTIGTATVTDQDLNLRSEYIDTTTIRLASKADSKGLDLVLYETGIDTGLFSGSFSFDRNITDNEKTKLKINPTDTITAFYIDDYNSDNKANVTNSATADFQFGEAKIETSAANMKNTGNMLEITLSDADANMLNTKDRASVKVWSDYSSNKLNLRLEEVSGSSGIFKGIVYFTQGEPDDRTLQVSAPDKITISYLDDTLPTGESKEIIEKIDWNFDGSSISFDKDKYEGYNSMGKITLSNMDLNKYRTRVESVNVSVFTSTSRITLALKETSADSGQFTGTFYFGKTTSASKNTIKVTSGDSISASYSEKGGRNTVEATAAWGYQDGQISLDRQEYKGNGTPVRITVKDLDIAVDVDNADDIKIAARVQSSARFVSVRLTETSKNSGIFTGILYINGSGNKTPTIALKPSDILEVVYTDKDTTGGSSEDRIAHAVWTGISEAVLTLDKDAYVGYDTYMTITFTDPDQNKSTTARDKVNVNVKTKSGRTNLAVSLIETGNNTGIFISKFKLSDEAPDSVKIRVSSEDEITITFVEKNIQASAEFKK